MDKEHREILIEKRVELVENINIEDGLLTQLMAKKVFKPRTLHKIQACKTPEAQIECLLDTLPLTGNTTFDKFCEALVDDGQEFIVDLYLKSKSKTDQSSTAESQKDSTNVQPTTSNVPNSSTVHNQSQRGEPVRPNSSPPRIISQTELSAPSSQHVQQRELSPPRLQAAPNFDTAHALVPSHSNQHHPVHFSQSAHNVPLPSTSSTAFISVHNPPCSEGDGHSYERQQFMQTHPSAFNSFTKTSNGFGGHNPANLRNNNVSDFDIEKRYNMKHFIDDPSYNVPPLLPPKSIPTSNLAVPYPGNVIQGRQEIVYLAASHVGQTNEELFRNNDRMPDLSRSDSLDAMTKHVGNENSDHTESPSKRQRVEDVIKIPIYNFPPKPPEPNVVVLGESVDPGRNTAIQIARQGEDSEVDSTDGAVAVRVALCTRQFYLAHYKKAYSMKKIPRGKALIMNVNEVEGKPARRGTDIDRDNLENLLSQLHFDVTKYNDCDGLTAQEMAVKLQDFASDPAHRLGEACVICLLSHGEEGHIYGTDGKKLELDSVFNLFSNVHCKFLMGKPKIFIIQACRGGALDSGVSFEYQDEHDGSTNSFRQLPTLSDMIICFPTQTGYYAWRNRERGSWYIEALVQIFMKYAKSEDICTMLNRVNLLVSQKVSRCPQIEMDSMSQMSEYKSTLRMPHLFFFPGIGSG